MQVLDVDLSSVVTSQEDGTTPLVGRAEFQSENVLGRRWEFEDSASTLIYMRKTKWNIEQVSAAGQQVNETNMIQQAGLRMTWVAHLLFLNKIVLLFLDNFSFFFFKSALILLSIAKTKQIYILEAFGVMNEWFK